MTNKQAIEWLVAIKEKYIHGGDEGFDELRKEALDMAVKSLKEERPFEGITPVQNIKVGYFEKEEYLRIINRQGEQINSFAEQIMALQAEIDRLEEENKKLRGKEE